MSLKDYSILNSPVSTDGSVSGGKASVTGLADAIKLDDVLSYTHEAYAAGTVSAKTYDYSGLTSPLTADTLFQVRVSQNGVERLYQYHGSVGDLNSEVVTALLGRITADSDAVVEDNSTATTDLKLKLKAANINDGDFSVALEGYAAGETVDTAYVEPIGTPSLVEAEIAPEDISDVSATGTYSVFTVKYNDFDRSNVVNGSKVGVEKEIKIFSDEVFATSNELEAKLDAMFGNASKDSRAEFEALAAKRKAVSSAENLTGVEGIVEVSGTTTVTLPPVAEVSAGYIMIVKNADAALVTTIEGDAAETVDGGANITLAAGKAAMVYCTGTAWLSFLSA